MLGCTFNVRNGTLQTAKGGNKIVHFRDNVRFEDDYREH